MVGTEEKTATQLYNSPTTLHLHLGEMRGRERSVMAEERLLTTDRASSYFFLKATSHAHFPLQTHKPSITHTQLYISL